MVKDILQKESKLLRKISKEISIKDITSPRIKDILKDMKSILSFTKDGVALAAPQIGESLRLFVVSPNAFPEEKRDAEHLVYINPEITRKSGKKIEMEEGCLSVRDVFGIIKRYDKVTVRARDENGKLFTRGASGLLAEIFQHEIDHLDGTLFIDTARDLHEIKRDAEQ